MTRNNSKEEKELDEEVMRGERWEEELGRSVDCN